MARQTATLNFGATATAALIVLASYSTTNAEEGCGPREGGCLPVTLLQASSGQTGVAISGSVEKRLHRGAPKSVSAKRHRPSPAPNADSRLLETHTTQQAFQKCSSKFLVHFR